MPIQRPFLTVDIAKRPDRGEDAPPLVLVGTGCQLLAVFDGLGGAGSQLLIDAEGVAESGAYRASRLASREVKRFFCCNGERTSLSATQDLAARLRERLNRAFDQELARFKRDTSPLKGSLIKRLPTTMAIVHLQHQAEQRHLCRVFWVGDSRAYLLTPHEGLQQLTIDDLREPGDAWENLFNDSPLSNVVSEKPGFTVNSSELVIDEPVVVLVATDGCFGYVGSPPQFELLLLEALEVSSTMEEWQARLQEGVSGITGDDATLAAVLLGWNDDFLKCRAAFRNRCEVLMNEQMLITPDSDQDHLWGALDARREWWERYKPTYEAYMPPREPEQ